MDYVTKYSYGASSNFPFWAVGFIFLVLGLVIIRAFAKIKGTIWNGRSIFGMVTFAFALIWTCAAFSIQSGDKAFVNNEIKEERIRVVTGVVSQFDAMPESGHRLESFYVESVYFEYSDFIIIEGFHNTRSHGGPINGNGDSVRISYYTKKGENYIVKLEMKESKQ